MPPGMGILMHELAAKAGLISDVGDCAAGKLSVEKGVSSQCWVLATELQALVDLDLDVEITGFSSAEVEILCGQARAPFPGQEHARMTRCVSPTLSRP
jgi:hypothetical protein